VLIVRATEQCVPDEDQAPVEFDPDDDTLLKVGDWIARGLGSML
jgi:hypothetical protein